MGDSGESVICQNVNLSNNIPNSILIGWFHYSLSSWKKKVNTKKQICVTKIGHYDNRN